MGGSVLMGGLEGMQCIYVPNFNNMETDQLVATVFNLFIWVVSVASLLYYFAHARVSTCGWEEVYVCGVELIKVVAEVFFELCVPVTFNEVTGQHVVWIRYAEWLLTCPVILMHLSNLTGLADDYNKRTMSLLVSDLGTIVMGITAAVSGGYVKFAFFLLGLCYGSVTFFHAGRIHLEAFYSMPRGECRRLVKWMAITFFLSWGGYPILFLLGSEGFFNILSPWWSVAAHCIVDFLSKNLWGFLGHHLRIKIHEYIALHGMVRAPRTHKVMWGLFELEVETFVENESVAGAVRTSMAGIANRKSFQNVRHMLVAQGKEVRSAEADSVCPSADGQSHAVSGDGGSRFLSAGGTTEVIMPSQFLMGNPRWRSSVAGGQQRVHPAGSNARGSLDWGIFGARWASGTRVAATEQAAAAAAAAAAGNKEEKTTAAGGGGGGDVSATVSVRTRASVAAQKGDKE